MHTGMEEQERLACGGFAATSWLIGCLYLFLLDGSQGGLWTVKALAFFSLGAFAAAVVVGDFLFALQRGALAAFGRAFAGWRGEQLAGLAQTLSWLVHFGMAMALFLIADWFYRTV